jgi:replicative DNA helicase
MIYNNSVINNVLSQIVDDDFGSETNRDIFREIIKLHGKQSKVDISILNSSKCADPYSIAILTDSVPSGANWQYYATQVRRYSMLRQVKDVMGKYDALIPDDIEKNVDDIVKSFIKIADRSAGDSRAKSMIEVMSGVMKRLEKAIANRGHLSGHDTGLDGLNSYTDGLQNELIFIGARPAIGKSAFAMTILVNIAKTGVKGAMFQIEMSDVSLGMRMVASESGISSSLIRSGAVYSGVPLQRINDAMSTISELPIIIDDKTNEIHEMTARIRYLVRCEGVKIIFIDHFSIIRNRNEKKPRHEQYIEISGMLRELKKELCVPIVVLTQVGRDKEGKEPTLADIRETGAAEQDAETVIFLHRERQQDLSQEEIPTDLIIAKQREGPCGKAKIVFHTKTVRFYDEKNGSVK